MSPFQLSLPFLFLILSASFLSAAEPVEILTAPVIASPVESAAADLVSGLQKVFPNDKFVRKTEASAERRIEIVIDGKGTAESFRITKINGANSGVRIAGADALGAVYGVYALLEQYGCGFYLTYDTLPAPEKGNWTPPQKILDGDFADAPLIKERYSFNWHNFLSGCSGWDLPQWKSWIDQCRKLRYNVVMVHAYGNNPMFTFEFKGISKPVGFIANTVHGRDWGTPHVNDVRRMIGGEHFTEPIFGAPASLVSLEQRAEAVQKMMKQVFAHAKAQGMKIAFQIDVDTASSNPPEMIAALPDDAKIKAGKIATYRPLPDTAAGKEFYTVILKKLFELYPEIGEVVVCTRTDPEPGGFSVQNFPEHWKKEFEAVFEAVKDRPELSKPNQLAAYFWTGKVVKAFQEITKEIGYGNVAVSQASWRFAPWVPYADACSPKDVAFLPLDWQVVQDKSEFDSPEEIQWVRRFTDSGRRIIPIIWSHHDDGHYLGRTYTPYTAFASHLEKAGCDSFGIIHWVLRPHDLYFKSHSVQVWQTTKDQPLEDTCRTMAKNLFGADGEQTGGEYLYDWIRTAPMFGRDTTDFMIDRPFTDEKFDLVQKDGNRRRKSIQKIKISAIPGTQRHLAYWIILEEFIAQYWGDEHSLQQSVNALKLGDFAAAKEFLHKAYPKSAPKKYVDYASQLGMLPGDRGLLVLMNLKWYPAFVGQRQLLGLDDYRINFAPTQHEPLAQGAGHRSFHIDTEKNLWLVQGGQELGGEEWTWAETQPQKTEGLTESEKEIVRSGLRWDKPVRIPIIPAMLSKFAPANFDFPTGVSRKLRVYVADPNVKIQGGTEFDLVLYRQTGKDEQPLKLGLKLGTIKQEPDTAQVFEYEIPKEFSGAITLGIEHRKGKVSICGIVLGH